MFDVRFHGRGGQGVVTAAEMLSVAAFDSGLHAQAFPTFGSERTGAPVTAFCRIADAPIRYHEPIDAPDAIVVQDPTLLHVTPALAGAGVGTYVLVNSGRTPQQLGLPVAAPGDLPRVVTLPASDLARAGLGRPLPNTALLGALAALTHVVPVEAICEAIWQRFPGPLGDANVAVAERAYAALAARVEVDGRA